MKKFAFAGAVAAVAAFAIAGAASAGTTFTQDGASPSSGYVVIDNFDNANGLFNSTGNGYLLTTNHDSNGAPPANSIPYDTQYLSVLGGGGVSINFADLTSYVVKAFQFDWGSIDSYNTLVIHQTGGPDITIIPGTLSFPNAANGDQVSPGTNGLFQVTGDDGQTFTGITLTSGSNSFEIDNLAIAVPEPATWAMMIMGLGAMGMALRSRRRTAAALA